MKKHLWRVFFDYRAMPAFPLFHHPPFFYITVCLFFCILQQTSIFFNNTLLPIPILKKLPFFFSQKISLLLSPPSLPKANASFKTKSFVLTTKFVFFFSSFTFPPWKRANAPNGRDLIKRDGFIFPFYISSYPLLSPPLIPLFHLQTNTMG